MQPTESEKMTFAFELLVVVDAAPDRHTEDLKALTRCFTQTVSARLTDLLDMGLVEEGPPAKLKRGNKRPFEVMTFRVTPLGRDLVALPSPEARKALRAAFSALHGVTGERARALADVKAEWRSRVAHASQGALLRAMGIDLDNHNFEGMM